MSHLSGLDAAMREVDAYYKERGIFQERFGIGETPAIVVVDFAYGWTDDAYAGGSRRLDVPIDNTARLLAVARGLERPVPIVYTTSPYHPETGDQPFKSAADRTKKFRAWDRRACQIDERVAPTPQDLVIEKENASAFFGTHLAGYLIEHRVDTLLITGCSTSACIHATAVDAKSYRFRPIIIGDCVGDRAQAAHEWTLFDIQARFADVEPLETVLDFLRNRGPA
jgi:N-carbamoylsarcosine amidase